MPVFSRIFTSILAISWFQGIFARHNGFRHEAVDASKQKPEKRSDPLVLNSTSLEQCITASPSATIHSIIYPSPDASPVEITTQSQTITSFIPEMTWCVGPPVGLKRISTAPYSNNSIEYETLVAGSGHCETVYVPTTTTVCATTLTGIATKITVSECDQVVTFSSECGFTLETPKPTPASPTLNNSLALITPAPTVRKLMTYWMAPWQSLTAGDTPSDVDMKICRILDNGDEMECTQFQEVWEVIIVTTTSTSTHDVQLTTTVSGPGTLMIETMKVHVTDTFEIVVLSTSLLLESEVKTESTSKKSKKLVTRTDDDNEVPTSTLFITKHLKHKTAQ